MSERAKTEGLKPCPFCGSIPVIEPWHGGGPDKHMVSCNAEHCDVSPGVTGETRAEAIEKWSYRAPIRCHRGHANVPGIWNCPTCTDPALDLLRRGDLTGAARALNVSEGRMEEDDA